MLHASSQNFVGRVTYIIQRWFYDGARGTSVCVGGRVGCGHIFGLLKHVKTTLGSPWKYLLVNYVLQRINFISSSKTLHPSAGSGWENNVTARRARKQLAKCRGEDSVSFPTVLTIVE